MNDRVGWVLVLLLTLSCAWSARSLLAEGPSFATLPIFVPVSLAYERQMRLERGQPAGRGGEEAIALVRALLDEDALDPALAPRITALRTTRDALLDARGRRHARNVALLNVGVEVARELTPAQWDHIQAQRDAVRAQEEAALFDRLLEALR